MGSLPKHQSHGLTVSVPAVICVLLALLGSTLLLYQYRQSGIAEIDRIDQDLNRAVNDSYKGLLHLQFADDKGVSQQQGQGVALLSESVRTLARLSDNAVSLANPDELEAHGARIEAQVKELIVNKSALSDLEFKASVSHVMTDIASFRYALRDLLDTQIRLLNRFFNLAVIAAFIVAILATLLLWRLNRRRLHRDLELLETRRWLGEISDNLSDVFWSLGTPDGQVLFISPSCSRLYGVSQQAVHENPSARFKHIHPDDQARVLDLYKGLMAGTSDGYDSIYRLCAPAGELRWVHEVAKPVRGRNGASIRLAGVARDVTEQYRLHQQHSLLQRMAAESPDVVLISEHDHGSDDRLVFASKAVEKIFGVCPEVIQGQPFSALFNRTGLSAGSARLLEALTQCKHRIFEVALPAYAGPDIVLEATLVPIVGCSGDVTHLCTTLRDITRRKQGERQLLQVQRINSIREWTGVIAHDFNNLLSVVGGSAELLVAGLATDQELRPLAELVSKAADKGAGLTRSLRAFARRQPLNPERLHVDELLTSLAPSLRGSVGDRIDLKLCLQEWLWPVLVDPVQLESTIVALAINARDAMGGVGCLTLTAANIVVTDQLHSQFGEIPAADYVELRVQDTGGGLQEGTALDIFEPFHTTKQGCLGLGLSMVFGFVQQSGGYIEVLSRVDEGATFILYLPRIDVDQMASPAPFVPMSAS